jgi:hypothetical protein
MRHGHAACRAQERRQRRGRAPERASPRPRARHLQHQGAHSSRAADTSTTGRVLGLPRLARPDQPLQRCWLGHRQAFVHNKMTICSTTAVRNLGPLLQHQLQHAPERLREAPLSQFRASRSVAELPEPWEGHWRRPRSGSDVTSRRCSLLTGRPALLARRGSCRATPKRDLPGFLGSINGAPMRADLRASSQGARTGCAALAGGRHQRRRETAAKGCCLAPNAVMLR